MQKILKLTNTKLRPLTEHQIVEATFEFANGAELDIEGLVDPSGSKVGNDWWPKFMLKLIKQENGIGKVILRAGGIAADAIPTTVEQVNQLTRTRIRERLATLISNPAALADEVLKNQLLPTYSPPTVRAYWRMLDHGRKGMQLAYHYTFSGAFELAQLGSILMLDTRYRPGRPCQCQLESCGRFFFEKRDTGGRPQRKYCNKEHMLQAHAEGAAQRTAKRRARLARAR